MRAKDLLALIIICLISLGDKKTSTAAPVKPKLYASAPRFAMLDEAGRNVTLDSLAGKIVVLEWFDPGNDYTRRDAKAGTNRILAARYRDKGVVWLAINSTRTSETSANKRWADSNKLGYPVLDDSRGVMLQSFGITTAPFYFILDRSGHVAYEGPLDDDDNRALDQGPKEGRINYVDRALGQMTSGQAVDRAEPRVYGDSLNQ